VDISKELVIVDDGSTDGTRDKLRALPPAADLRIIHHPVNMGKGAAVRTALAEAKGDVVVIQDADLEYDPQEFHELMKPILRGDADVVYGSRLSGGRPQRVYLFWHRVANKLLSLALNVLYNTTLTDLETCYKMFTRPVLESLHLRANGFDIEPEITAKIFRGTWRVYELPISYYGRTYREGKKIRFKDGLIAMWTLIKYRFTD
jgi:glycosyltransferase involved in cell wall biosynthesis